MGLYGHYETMTVPQGDTFISLVRIKFSSSHAHASKLLNDDYKILAEKLIPLLKQIPASQRDYNPITKIWTIPFTSLDIVRMVCENLGYGGIRCHNLGLDAFLNPPQDNNYNNNGSRPTWADSVKGQVNFKSKVEEAEDFFKEAQIETTVSVVDVEKSLKSLMLPYVTFELETREDIVRGYKITARKLHPDLSTGNAALMSELNQLYSQYKEMAGAR